jgi:hypothetical protein
LRIWVASCENDSGNPGLGQGCGTRTGPAGVGAGFQGDNRGGAANCVTLAGGIVQRFDFGVRVTGAAVGAPADGSPAVQQHAADPRVWAVAGTQRSQSEGLVKGAGQRRGIGLGARGGLPSAPGQAPSRTSAVVLPLIRTLTVGPRIPLGQSALVRRLAGYNRRFGVSPTPETRPPIMPPPTDTPGGSSKR